MPADRAALREKLTTQTIIAPEFMTGCPRAWPTAPVLRRFIYPAMAYRQPAGQT